MFDVFATGPKYSTAIAFRGSRALHQNRSLAGMHGIDTPAESSIDNPVAKQQCVWNARDLQDAHV